MLKLKEIGARKIGFTRPNEYKLDYKVMQIIQLDGDEVLNRILRIEKYNNVFNFNWYLHDSLGNKAL